MEHGAGTRASIPGDTMPAGAGEEVTIRIAACADVHCRADRPNATVEALAGLDGVADILLLAGDLTTLGLPEEARTLAKALGGLEIPVVCVLGNHDWHSGRHDEVVAELVGGGLCVLDRAWTVRELRGIEVGIVGAKGFVGGFPGSHLPDFGEPALRAVYAETTAEVEAIDAGLRAVAVCPLRVVLLHYSPTTETLAGEREAIWAFLGTDRLAAPINEHQPDLVVHGHAHSGRFAGRAGEVEVFNVSAPVIGRHYWLFELETAGAAGTAIR
jgi:Icc-related predicted phosphoesterase